MREFEEKVAGKLRQWQLLYDLGAWHAVHVMAAAGEWDTTHRPPDIEDLLGRPMLALDPRDDEDQDEDQAEELDEAEEHDRLEDARETAELMVSAGMARRGRYTPEQMAAMNRGEPVS